MLRMSDPFCACPHALFLEENIYARPFELHL